jgi:hypothetical protein
MLDWSANAQDRIRPWKGNPTYWEYKGKPILLAGGSKDDNLFQIPDLKEHLDGMNAVGGNYVRNTMSDRHDFGFEVYPYRESGEGQYNLDEWNVEYWTRFENFLNWTEERQIIVQIEVWDRFDYSDGADFPCWQRHPYNPQNNINYTDGETGLKPAYPKHPGTNEQPFFFTVPTLKNILPVLKYQTAFVDKMLSYSLKHGNVLYCMDNETSGAEEWSLFWAKQIWDRAQAKGIEIFLTEMWDPWDLENPVHRRTYDHPEIYNFIDVSQNNHISGQEHWDKLQWALAYQNRHPRPVNCVKTYGADSGRFGFGNSRDGLERFWRNLLGGAASCRFHRPDSGLGLNAEAKAHVVSLRMLEKEFDFFNSKADVSSNLLSEREPNEAYLRFSTATEYVVYFPKEGEVSLNLEAATGRMSLKWLDLEKSEWNAPTTIQAGTPVKLVTPFKGHCLALIKKEKPI